MSQSVMACARSDLNDKRDAGEPRQDVEDRWPASTYS
jgi:hypothetical protein